MSAKDFLTVPMPPAVARLDKDRRGYPIPASVQFVNGVPDFAAVDPQKWLRLYKIRGCGICGQAMHGRVFFVGGPLCETNRLFYDHPMHEDCAKYALMVCPFLAIPKMAYRKHVGDAVSILKSVSTNKPDLFMLGKTKGYTLMQNGSEILMHAQPWESIEWWQNGAPFESEIARMV